MGYRDERWPRRPQSDSGRRFCLGLISHRRNLLILILLAIFLYHHIPAPPKTENNTRADRPAPRYEVETRPHFLHRSHFRRDPDIRYEAELAEALHSIERSAPLKDGGDGDDEAARERIWQILLQKGSRPLDRSPDSELFEERNAEWTYSLATKDWATKFVTTNLAGVPGLSELWNSYPSDVLRADLLRYLVLWYYGGYYADMDVFPALSIKECPPLAALFHPASAGEDLAGQGRPHAPPNVSLIVGVEIDEPYATPQLMREWHWSRSYGFIQYTMYAPRRFSPLLRRAIIRVLAHTRHHNERSSFIRGPRYNERTILEVTGPGVFTDALLDLLSDTLPPTHPLIMSSVEADSDIGDLVSRSGNPERRVTWAPFHKLQEPLWVDASEAAPGRDMGGVGILPVTVWGNGQRHSGAGGFTSDEACINHRFGRTWKKGWWEYLFG